MARAMIFRDLGVNQDGLAKGVCRVVLDTRVIKPVRLTTTARQTLLATRMMGRVWMCRALGAWLDGGAQVEKRATCATRLVLRTSTAPAPRRATTDPGRVRTSRDPGARLGGMGKTQRGSTRARRCVPARPIASSATRLQALAVAPLK